MYAHFTKCSLLFQPTSNFKTYRVCCSQKFMYAVLFYNPIAENTECPAPGPLILGMCPIPDEHMTSTSDYDSQYTAPKARMNSELSWTASLEARNAGVDNFYIQVGK